MKPRRPAKFSKSKVDAKDKNFFKDFGELEHPIKDIDVGAGSLKRAKIVHDDSESSSENESDTDQISKEKILNSLVEKESAELENPYLKLLNELDSNKSGDDYADSDENESAVKKKKKKTLKRKQRRNEEGDDEEDDDEDEEGMEEEEEEEEEEEMDEEDENNFNTYSQEVLCKDHLEAEESIKNDPFHKHFEKTIDQKFSDALKSNQIERHEKSFKWPIMGDLTYSYPFDEEKVDLKPNDQLKHLFVKQRIIDHLNESIKNLEKEETDLAAAAIADNDQADQATSLKRPSSTTGLFQLELLNILLNYVDFYHANVDLKIDGDIKYAYALHAINHVLKTRSRIIAHNDKMKQSSSKSNRDEDVEYRDQGLTRPKVLILVPFKKYALKIVKIIISLLTHKKDESKISVSNKKRFFDSFGPTESDEELEELKSKNKMKKKFRSAADEDDDAAAEKNDNNGDDEHGEEEEADAENKNRKDENYELRKKPEDFKMLSIGNVDDHFRIGLSVSKKSLKLYTEFYSSDIIIASPLGLLSVINGEESKSGDYDFLSSIEILVVDNSDVLMMQNWEHVLTILEHLHLQPKKSHNADFSRCRHWLLDGLASFYRQTIIFSQIPAPPINMIFNKYCKNFSGKCQLDLVKLAKNQTGSIIKIGFQLSQMFHKIDIMSSSSLVDLANARFQFFTEKILPKFKDEMMSHTLIFIPSYFDFIKLRNYLKKNDYNFMHLTEYDDKKAIDRARFLFFKGRIHFLLVTERFHFYKRYRIRGINHLIFYELPHYPEYYSSFCNYLPDPKRKNVSIESFSTTVLYSKYDAQRLCSVVGQKRATHMINSDKNVHMFMIDGN